jgi:colanic acid/amylovoran biosynthesis glycosyltransferase
MNTDRPIICIVSPGEPAYSETFVRAHIERLPAETHVLYGGPLPTHADGEPLVTEYSLSQRVRFRVERQFRGLLWDGEAKQAAAIERFVRQHEVQAVLAEYGPTGVAMMELCQRMGLPLIVHFHGFDAYRLDVLNGTVGKRYPDLFAAASALVVVSTAMQDQLMDLGAPKPKLHYNPYGIDLALFHAANPASNPPTFVAVGRFVDKKAPYLTLMAFAELARRVPAARLIMAGDGDLWEACQRMAHVLGVAAAVEFRGVCSHSQVANLMQQGRGFVQHSVSAFSGDSEGTPVAILEASAAGLPIVATRHAGIPDVVVEGETGFLVDEGDVAAMAEAMLSLALEPQLAARMGQAGRRRIEWCFSMEKSIGNLWRIIEATMKGRDDACAAG